MREFPRSPSQGAEARIFPETPDPIARPQPRRTSKRFRPPARGWDAKRTYPGYCAVEGGPTPSGLRPDRRGRVSTVGERGLPVPRHNAVIVGQREISRRTQGTVTTAPLPLPRFPDHPPTRKPPPSYGIQFVDRRFLTPWPPLHGLLFGCGRGAAQGAVVCVTWQAGPVWLLRQPIPYLSANFDFSRDSSPGPVFTNALVVPGPRPRSGRRPYPSGTSATERGAVTP